MSGSGSWRRRSRGWAKPEIKSLKDPGGKTIAISQPGALAIQELNVRLGTQSQVVAPEEAATWDVQKRVVAGLGPFPK